MKKTIYTNTRRSTKTKRLPLPAVRSAARFLMRYDWQIQMVVRLIAQTFYDYPTGSVVINGEKSGD